MKKIKVYDIDAFVRNEVGPQYQALFYDKAAIFEGDRGVVFAESEAVHQRKLVLTDSVEVPCCLRPEKGRLAVFATHTLRVSFDELIEKAPHEEMGIEEFFTKRNYNPRCIENYETLMSSLRNIGFDLHGYFDIGPKIEEMKSYDGIDCLMVDDRYQIYLDDGCVYDTEEAKDIPPYVFEVRDKAMAEKGKFLEREVAGKDARKPGFDEQVRRAEKEVDKGPRSSASRDEQIL